MMNLVSVILLESAYCFFAYAEKEVLMLFWNNDILKVCNLSEYYLTCFHCL